MAAWDVMPAPPDGRLRRTLSETWEQFGRRVISGDARGVRASAMRLGLSVASPLYAGLMRARNWKYDRGIGVACLPRPVVSVGNLTTGGTGKTPVVRWLCERLRDAGRRPAVLMRGYRAAAGERGDEQAMLEGLLNRPGVEAVPVHADATRFEGGQAVLAAHPEVNVFVLDDGFQHRQLGRDFDLVLVDASNPFGHGRVIPRGLLREPLSGLRRADAVLITRADQGDVEAIARTVRQHNATVPLYRCTHAHAGLRADEAGDLKPLRELVGRSFFAFAGIGNPEGLVHQLAALRGRLAGTRWFGDHWNYSEADVGRILKDAEAADADLVLTTEKDWTKVRRFAAGAAIPIWRLELAVRFRDDDESKLFEQIQANLAQHA
jgi:tetraacyldisaccharide 4'-kinase